MKPERPVRQRHAATAQGKTSATGDPLQVAVVGAGLSGLACARSLADHGHRVVVVDKARGPGGRMSTRRSGELAFDHGAQYFTVRDRRFKRWVESWRADGLVAPWSARIATLDRGKVELKDTSIERTVGVPGMSAVCRSLAADLDVRYGIVVTGIERHDGRWRVKADGEAGLGGFDAVVVSAPAPQSAALLAEAAPDLARRAARVDMAPCWAVMAVFPEPLELGFDGAFVLQSPLSWVARNGTKPHRPAGEAWVLHGSPSWSRDQLELGRDAITGRLLDALSDSVGRPLPEPRYAAAHRWRFALPVEPLEEPCLFDPDLAIGACGDWCGGPRVEGAFLSGCAAAQRVLSLAWPDSV